MAGFGKAKQMEASKDLPSELQNTQPAKASPQQAKQPMTQKKADAFADLRAELTNLHQNRPKTHMFVGIAGHENTGKSAIVLDAFVKDEEATKRGDTLEILDFDGGGSASASAFYPDNDRIRCWDTWVMQTNDRTAYDYPETHNRVMKIMQFALQRAKDQNAPDYDGPRLWGVHITGVDLWDSVCVNNMRIVDLNLAKDGIDSADWNVKVGHQWDWAIRKTRFHQLTAVCKGLVKQGVRIFWETHLRMTNYSFGKNEEAAKWRPDWEKASNNFVFQIITMNREDTYDDETGKLLKSEYTATFDKCKTNAQLQGQKRTVLVTEVGKPAVFLGLPELYDGSL
jgi:hypothetical protein